MLARYMRLLLTWLATKVCAKLYTLPKEPSFVNSTEVLVTVTETLTSRALASVGNQASVRRSPSGTGRAGQGRKMKGRRKGKGCGVSHQAPYSCMPSTAMSLPEGAVCSSAGVHEERDVGGGGGRRPLARCRQSGTMGALPAAACLVLPALTGGASEAAVAWQRALHLHPARTQKQMPAVDACA